jgi:hypothetical protein
MNAQSAIVSRNAMFGSFHSFLLDGRDVLRDADALASIHAQPLETLPRAGVRREAKGGILPDPFVNTLCDRRERTAGE